VNSNPTSAAASADELVNTINDADKEAIIEKTRNTLLTDARAISQSKEINFQREKFEPLSNNMFKLAKTIKLTAEPIYHQYCPMKKATWLSNNKAIKNPYYGTAML